MPAWKTETFFLYKHIKTAAHSLLHQFMILSKKKCSSIHRNYRDLADLVENGKNNQYQIDYHSIYLKVLRGYKKLKAFLTNTNPELQICSKCLTIDVGQDLHFLDNLLSHHIKKSCQRGKTAYSCPLTFDLDPRSPPSLGHMTFPLRMIGGSYTALPSQTCKRL